MRIRMAVLGTGFIAHSNVPGALATGDFEIAALCNRTLSKAEAFRDKYSLNCPVFDDFRAMDRAVEFDTILIETPHDLHEEAFCYFAGRGKNILIEKPLAHSEAAAMHMRQIAEDCGIRATVCHTQRYNPILITAKHYLDTHDLGKLISVNDTITYHYFWDGRPQWFLQPERAGGGIIMNYGVHQLDRVHFLTGGKCASLYAHIESEKEGIDTDSSYHITCLSPEGQVWQFACTGYTNPFSNRIEMRFTKGILRAVLIKNGLEEPGVYWGSTESDFQAVQMLYPGANAYELEMKEAADYLLGRTDKAPVSIEYAARMVQLVDLAKRSNAENQVFPA